MEYKFGSAQSCGCCPSKLLEVEGRKIRMAESIINIAPAESYISQYNLCPDMSNRLDDDLHIAIDRNTGEITMCSLTDGTLKTWNSVMLNIYTIKLKEMKADTTNIVRAYTEATDRLDVILNDITSAKTITPLQLKERVDTALVQAHEHITRLSELLTYYSAMQDLFTSMLEYLDVYLIAIIDSLDTELFVRKCGHLLYVDVSQSRFAIFSTIEEDKTRVEEQISALTERVAKLKSLTHRKEQSLEEGERA
jgi:hypothetical protein